MCLTDVILVSFSKTLLLCIMLLTFNITPAGSTIHFYLHHGPFTICISSRKLDLRCLDLYTCIVRTNLNGNKEDDGVIIVHLTSLYQLLAAGL